HDVSSDAPQRSVDGLRHHLRRVVLVPNARIRGGSSDELAALGSSEGCGSTEGTPDERDSSAVPTGGGGLHRTGGRGAAGPMGEPGPLGGLGGPRRGGAPRRVAAGVLPAAVGSGARARPVAGRRSRWSLASRG